MHSQRPLDFPPHRRHPLRRRKLRRLHLRVKLPRSLLRHLRRVRSRWQRRLAIRHGWCSTPRRPKDVSESWPTLECDNAVADRVCAHTHSGSLLPLWTQDPREERVDQADARG